MRGSISIALAFISAAVFIAIGAVLHQLASDFLLDNATLLVMALLGGAALLLFIFGIFAGYLYGKPERNNPLNKGVLDRFRSALEFERRQRTRFEHELYESKQAMAGLEDELQRTHQLIEDLKASEERLPNEEELDVEELVALRGRSERLQQDLLRRKERIADLQAELSEAQAEAERMRHENDTFKSSMASGIPLQRAQAELHGDTLGEVLGEIANLEGVYMVVVADDFGLVVDFRGQSMPAESLAATASLFGTLDLRVRDLLPGVGSATTVCYRSDKGMALDVQFFPLFGARCALVIARDATTPYPELAKTAAETIIQKLSD